MKKIAFFLLLCASMHGSAQSTFPNVQIGISFSPDYCYRSMFNNDGSSSSSYVVTDRQEHERPKIGYTTGLNFVYNLSEILGLEVGLHYSNKGYQYVTDNDLTFGSGINTATGSSYTSGTPTSARFIYRFNYLDIPLKANFTFGHGAIRFATSAGAALNVLFNEKVKTVAEYADGHNDTNTHTSSYNYNTINVSPFVSAGIDWQIGSSSHLKIMPVFRYGVLKIIDDPVSARLWNAGINIGYYIGL